DLADQAHTPLGKLGAGFVGVLHGPVHTVAEPELARELERQVADREDVALGADAIHHAAVIVRRERSLDVALETEAASEIGLFHGGQSNRAPRPSRTASMTRCTARPS